MGSIKTWLEEISEELGFKGEINDAVLREGEKRRDELYREETDKQIDRGQCRGQMDLFAT
jgi:hypothetical protein